ncbi:isocitrate lyase/phosphoenolpyruvate mutase family protein, partial [Rhizobium ruizarguesonis]
MNQTEKAELFGKLHQKGNPVVLYNIWDAGTARAV